MSNYKDKKDMERVIEKPSVNIKSLLDKISDKLPLNKGKNKMIKLDRNDPGDVEWTSR